MVPLIGYNLNLFIKSIFINGKFITDNLTVDILLIILIVLLFIFSAFLASSYEAFNNVNTIRLKNYSEEKMKGARKAYILSEKFEYTKISIFIGINLSKIIITTIIVYFFMQIFLIDYLAIIIGIISSFILILLFSEIIPKSYGEKDSEKIVLNNSYILWIITKLFSPISLILNSIRKVVIKNKKAIYDKNPYVTGEELESLIDVMEDEGVFDEDNADLIQSAINLNTRTVYDIMTPRVDMVAIEINDSIDEIKQTFFDNQFSRIPVYEEDKDNILGILSERDFFTALIQVKETEKLNIKDLISKPYYVSKATKVDDLIKEMQIIKKHFAIVSDEYGGTSGIVTMEDALEELVGEIYDEYDEIENVELEELEPNHYLISTEMDLDDLFDKLNLGEVPETKYASVGGFVYELCDGLPTEGQEISYESIYENYSLEKPVVFTYNLTFIIKRVENRRIKSIELIVVIKNEEPLT